LLTIVRVTFISLLLAIGGFASGDDTGLPNIHLSGIPDMSQVNAATGLPGNGAMYCAPVAISNSLVWLESKNDPQYQFAVIQKLASREYMDTSPRSGTGVATVLRGLKKYVTEVHGGYQRLEYAGWRTVPESYHFAKAPSLTWMLSGLNSRAAVWLNIGWYFYDDNGGYNRKGGHWVTLVGYHDGKLIIHDPGPWADGLNSRQFVNFSVLSGGKLLGNYLGLPTQAYGYLKLDQATPTPYSGGIAIVDGAVLLDL